MMSCLAHRRRISTATVGGRLPAQVHRSVAPRRAAGPRLAPRPPVARTQEEAELRPAAPVALAVLAPADLRAPVPAAAHRSTAIRCTPTQVAAQACTACPPHRASPFALDRLAAASRTRGARVATAARPRSNASARRVNPAAWPGAWIRPTAPPGRSALRSIPRATSVSRSTACAGIRCSAGGSRSRPAVRGTQLGVAPESAPAALARPCSGM